MSDNDHLTEPMLSASMDEVIRLRTRIEALEAALHKIDDITIDHTAMGIARKALASAALAPEQDK
jgi:hypothetical protein